MDTSSTSDGLKILVVAPGPTYSTYDVYRYYLDALGRRVDWVKGFAYHNLLVYHTLATQRMYEEYGIDHRGSDHIMTRAARDLLLDVIVDKPDVVFFIEGSMFPPQLYSELLRLRRDMNRNFVIAVYLTEAPYTSEMNQIMARRCDVVFVNDRNAVRELDPEDNRMVYYLPHSYSKDVHFPGAVPEHYRQDVFFCGTGFPERVELLSAVDWSGIDLRLIGVFSGGGKNMPLSDDEEALEKLRPYIENRTVSNRELANYYRGSGIVLNIHRRTGWDMGLNLYDASGDAYSMNPRALEVAACGAFQLSDPRQEVIDVFGDSVPTYVDADDLSVKLRYYLERPDLRENLAEEARSRIAHMSYDDRAGWLVDIFSEAVEVRSKLMEVS